MQGKTENFCLSIKAIPWGSKCIDEENNDIWQEKLEALGLVKTKGTQFFF